MTKAQEYFTGLPPGPEHDRVVADGRNYIVLHLDPSNDNFVCMAEPNEETLTQVLTQVEWTEWTRVRAATPEDALARYFDAHDQWEAKTNGSPRWQDIPRHPWGDASAEREKIIAGG